MTLMTNLIFTHIQIENFRYEVYTHVFSFTLYTQLSGPNAASKISSKCGIIIKTDYIDYIVRIYMHCRMCLLLVTS